jgi:hypothetical protein
VFALEIDPVADSLTTSAKATSASTSDCLNQIGFYRAIGGLIEGIDSLIDAHHPRQRFAASDAGHFGLPPHRNFAKIDPHSLSPLKSAAVERAT